MSNKVRSLLEKKGSKFEAYRCQETAQPGTSNPTDPKGVTARSRVKEFPNKYLIARNSKLFCSARREEIALKESTITNHISSGEKHKKTKEALEKRQLESKTYVAKVLKVYDWEVQPKGSASVSMDARVYRVWVYRVRVVEQFLKSGIPMSKIDSLRSLLEDGSHRLTHSSHLSEYMLRPDCKPGPLESRPPVL